MMGYPPGAIKRTPRERVLTERAEALTGARNDKAPEKLAVTRENMGQSGSVKLLSERVAAAPTMEQHNALVEDVRQIVALLNKMGANFTGL